MVSRWLKRQSIPAQRVIALAVMFFLLMAIVVPVLEMAPAVFNAQSQWRAGTKKQLAEAKAWINREESIQLAAKEAKSSAVWQQFYSKTEGQSIEQHIEQDILSIFNSVGIPATVKGTVDGTQQLLRIGGVKIEASMTVDQLRLLCSAVRSHVPYLRMQRLEISAPLLDAHYSNPTVTANIEVVGYFVDSAIPVEQRTST